MKMQFEVLFDDSVHIESDNFNDAVNDAIARPCGIGVHFRPLDLEDWYTDALDSRIARVVAYDSETHMATCDVDVPYYQLLIGCKLVPIWTTHNIEQKLILISFIIMRSDGGALDESNT